MSSDGVPKFASFTRRKPDAKEASRTDPIERLHKRHLGSEKSIESSSKRSRKSKEHVVPQTTSEPSPANNTFISDRKGDPGNVKYGQKGKVPTYRPFRTRIFLDEHRCAQTDVAEKPLSSVQRLSLKERYVGPRDYDENKDMNFVPIRPKSQVKQSRSFDYQGKESDLSDVGDSTNEDESEHEGLEERNDTQDIVDTGRLIQAENAKLASLVSTNSANVDAWLKYIKHQEKVTSSDTFNAGVESGLAEIKLAIYEKALEQVKRSPEARHKLLVSLANERFAIHSSASRAKWTQIVNSNRDCLELLQAHLDDVQSNQHEFRFETCSNVYKEYFRLLRSTSSASARVKAHATLRAALFLRETGFAERATAIWQAQFEFNLFAPPHLQAGGKEEQLLSEFEEFWDAEHPRIGEPNALGWNATLVDTDTKNEASMETELLDYSPGSFKDWTMAELRAIQQQQRPSRVSDTADSEDPFRVVLFADIGDFLLRFTGQDEMLELVDAFLSFHQMPSLPPREGDLSSSELSTDPFIFGTPNELFSNNGPNGADSTSSDVTSAPEKFASSAESLFDKDGGSLGIVPELATVAQRHDGMNIARTDVAFVQELLQKLVQALPNSEELMEYFLAFLTKISPKKARSAAKVMLKKNPSSLRMYNAFALVELGLGKHEAAESVFSTAIKMSSSFEPAQRMQVVWLWRSWVWQAIRKGDDAEVIKRIRALASALDPDQQHTITKAQEQLTAWRDTCLASNTFHTATVCAELLVLITIFNAPQSIESDLAAFQIELEVISRHVAPNSTPVELLHQAQYTLITHRLHKRGAYSPQRLHAALSTSLSLFPNNTLFLDLHESLRAYLPIATRLTTTLPAGDENQSVLALAHSVASKMHRAEATAGGGAGAVRAAFERALRRHAKVSAWLWSAYMRFEIRRGEQRRSRDVFYRGVAAMPWNKIFAMLGFMLLEGSEAEMRALYRDMGARGIRFHIEPGVP